MSLSVFVAHSGKRLDADPVVFSSLDALKAWINNATTIPPQDQILLTPRGKHVKLQTLLTEKEIFLYDRDLFALPAPENLDHLVPPESLPKDFQPAKPPDTLSNQNDLAAWQNLFKARRDWALALREQCRSMAVAARECVGEQAVVERGVRVATSNHETHIRTLEQKQAEARAWFDAVAKEQEECVQSWEADLARLSSIPASQQFRRFISTLGSDAPRKQSRKNSDARTTLDTFVDVDKARKAASVSNTILDELEGRIVDMDKQIDKIRAEYNDLQNAVDQSQMHSSYNYQDEPMRLFEEIDVLVKKVDSDFEHVLGLPGLPKSVAQASKMALLHTRNYLPSLRDYSIEMSDLLKHTVERKNSAVRLAVEHLQTIATIESTLANANAAIASIELAPESQDALEALSVVSKMPYIYGILMVEAVRRQEWAEKLKRDSSALAEEIAGYREEEERRRKRWLKNNGDVINVDAAHDNALGIDINVQGQNTGWPAVTRQDFQEYLNILSTIGGMESIAEPLLQAFKDLDRPTRQQIKHAKGFKTGSAHDGLGKGSLLLRGEDETRVLRESMSKMEEELKSSKSRVRKLEDLLHRQSHISRLSIGGGVAPPTSQMPETPTMEQYPTVASPRPQENLSRHSSVSSRRYSANKSAEERALAQRIVQLENELRAEKEARANLEKEHSARADAVNDLQRHVEERVSTNKDLMENMEAMQKDWSDERRSLEEEIKKLRYRNEELEEELDRNLGSRDHERASYDEKRQELEAEVEQFRRDAEEEIQQQRERAEACERALQELENAQLERKITLQSAFSSLAKDESLPENSIMLAAELEKLAQKSKDYARELADAVEKAKSENEALTSAAAKQRNELEAQIKEYESDIAKKSEELATESARASSLAEELKDERNHLEDLRAKFAEGETGAKALRQRVSEEEAKVERLSVELSEAKTHVATLEKSLAELQDKYSTLQANSTNGVSRSEQQAKRARELSERLLAHNDRLHRLLETLGFAVTQQDNRMVIQRASRVAGQSAVLAADGSAAMIRSVSSPPPSRKPLENSQILEALKWTEQANPSAEEAMFAEFVATINRFDIETFSEAITKRMRDMEHTARKWQREARTYRDKSHRYQSEAHEKIAIRGFKEGDLALFLPTRNQATRPWAAFNVGAPHYFLREQESHRLHSKEWLVARITKVEERVVDLSKSMDTTRGSDGRSITSERSGISYEDDNPFELSDGLRWHLVEAAEEKVGAPLTPGLGKSTVDSTKVDAKGSIRMKKSLIGNDASKTLNKSLDSRRSSAGSKRSVTVANNKAPGPSSSAQNNGDAGEEAQALSQPQSGTTTLASPVPINEQSNSETPKSGSPPSKAASALAAAAAAGGSTDVAGPSANGKDQSQPSPTKQQQQQQPHQGHHPRKSGFFDSLWQLDISYERGKTKE
ncbi:Autophagy-related protein 11 [Macrophomina phaseolina MS6]|uniref:Autophagy-related protein 11 n=1 Tax=Macrophomina phaseolina (strain MS6) TaxID=1126212 RepID=K2RZT5_MACPH|nr:Autophagy-related protein 11 [Macrophomina phaseolina MS6]